jgi:putative membrane protein
MTMNEAAIQTASVPAGARYPLALLGVFAVIFIALGIAPLYRQDWLLENLVLLVALALFVATYRRMRFSNLAYTLLFILFVVHEVGAHYTYSLVPYDRWIEDLGGVALTQTLGFGRNHYDRLIHFGYGLLVTLPAIELLRRVAPPSGLWRALLPFLFILSHSAIYELIEWAAATVFGGELGLAYVGAQGDIWDSQKDMACAGLGSVIAMLFITATDAVRGRAARAG